ncbi:hypothetical protein TIFTF001_050460 [Ficus carica]|uniref:Secreted protein n=1 Tax=Ficus carica TaxID=3494 RepID=A0AA88CMI0_FICCA|nr:hypothetical protein TIFTF001_050460 [Ficus carica]
MHSLGFPSLLSLFTSCSRLSCWHSDTPTPSNPDKQAKLCGGKGKTYKCPKPPPCRSKYRRNCAPPNSSP